MLYPISSNWFVHAETGDVGIGTIDPTARLDVNGVVRTRSGVQFPDGTTQTTAQVAGPAGPVGPTGPAGLLIDGSANETAYHDGTTWVPTSNLKNDGATIGVGADPHTEYAFDVAASAASNAVRGWRGSSVAGFLGVIGTDDFGNVSTTDWLGLEMGVVGICTSPSPSGNIGVLGHANQVGVRGEYSNNPTVDYAELGTNGVGIVASGATRAGEFLGSVDVTGNLDVTGDLIAGNEIQFSNGTVQATAYPSTQKYAVGSGDFIGVNDLAGTQGANGNGGSLRTWGGMSLIAPVHLPDAATVTRVTFKCYDATGGAELYMQLRRSPHFSQSGANLATAQSSGSGGNYTQTASSISNATIDVDNYEYFVLATPMNGEWSGNGDLAINGVIIEYTVD